MRIGKPIALATGNTGEGIPFWFVGLAYFCETLRMGSQKLSVSQHMLARLRSIRFSLRLLLGIILVLGMVSAYARHRIKRSAEMGELIRKLKGYPGRVELSYGWDESTKPVTPVWIKPFVGDHFLTNVNGVCLRGDENINDETMQAVGKIKSLRRFTVSFTHVTDDGLRQLERLKRLERLSLTGAPLTDKGMETLGRMQQLRVLGLSQTNITDEGLKKLYELDHLEAIILRKTNTTRAGREALQAALPNCRVDLK